MLGGKKKKGRKKGVPNSCPEVRKGKSTANEGGKDQSCSIQRRLHRNKKGDATNADGGKFRGLVLLNETGPEKKKN